MEAITETDVPEIDQRLLAHGYAPGQYSSRCLACNAEIEWVDKRCRICKRCADLHATRDERNHARSLVVNLEQEIARLKEGLPIVEWNGGYAIRPEHAVADAFWKHWGEIGAAHKHGYYESTWGAINAALRAAPQEGKV